MSGIGSAPGKVILSGEHSVVYGEPAIVAAIGLRVECKIEKQDNFDGFIIFSEHFESPIEYTTDELLKLKNDETVNEKTDNIILAAINTHEDLYKNPNLKLTISSKIPVSAGLGSSAAVAVATVCAMADHLNKELTPQQISEISFKSEEIAHGNPSGIDNTIASHGGLLRYEEGNISPIKLEEQFPLLIINTKVPGDTKELVGSVKDLYNKYSFLDSIISDMGDLSDSLQDVIIKKNLTKMGELFDINQGLLDAIGVGHEKLSHYIWKCRKVGALGAKLTGGGGGGCLIALFENQEELEMAKQQISNETVDMFETNISPFGAKIGEI